MPAKVYIDGQAGTTGLRVRRWLEPRRDLELLALADAVRKDEKARQQQIDDADVVILCLPDEAARQAAAWARASSTRVIDASTAHRVDPDWVYGIPELEPSQRSRIRDAQQVANPGCYPTAFVLLIRPLIEAGVLAANTPLVCHALSGYSGGGRPMIERWQDPSGPLEDLPFEAPYALDRLHKHIPEMMHHTGLVHEPQFLPAVGPFECGMRVQVPIHARFLGEATPHALHEVIAGRYDGEPFVTVAPIPEPGAINELTFDPRECNDTNRLVLRVAAHPSGHALLVATLDNLGKGACGAAIQCLNLMLGLEETTALRAS